VTSYWRYSSLLRRGTRERQKGTAQTIMTSNTQKRTARRRRELDLDRDAGRRLAAIAAGRSLNAQRTDCAVAKADRFGPSPRFAYLTRTYD
jgi:hypothetical protein